MNRAHSRSRLRNPLPFTPLNLFSTGEQGVWYDPSDMTTLFQDDAGTVPVTAAGQVVGLMRDKSGNSHHAAQATAASKPILRNTGDLWWLEFDGVDDFMVTGSIDFTARDEISVFAGFRKLSDVARGSVVELSASLITNNGTFFLGAPNNAGLADVTFISKGTSPMQALATPVTAPVTVVATGQGDISAPLVAVRINGVLMASVATSQGAGNYGNFPLYIGRRGGTVSPFGGNLYGLVARGAFTGASTVSATEKYMATKSGLTL